MSIILNIIQSPKNCEIIESSKLFGEHGGTIGRSPDNYWVLSDPESFLSYCHGKISFENGTYFLTDLSTNGTYLNGSRESMGKGNNVRLEDGDEVEMSDYKFNVKFESNQSSNKPFDIEVPDYGDPFSSNSIEHSTESLEPILNSVLQETDPLVVLGSLDTASFNSNDPDLFSSNIQSHSDEADILNESITWPESLSASEIIPENWDLSKPVIKKSQLNSEKYNELQQENTVLKNEIIQLKQQLLAKKNTSNTSTIDKSVIKAMGLDKYSIDDTEINIINTTIGKMIREVIFGMIQVLRTRSSIKNEFRMNLTSIKAVDNNPLKFSASIDDALENLFIKKGASYMKPLDSIKDGFQGISEHQVAILAGIRAAFKDMFDRFNPSNLEKRFEIKSKSNLDMIHKLKNAKNWEHFIHYYDELTHDMDNSFQYLFGDKFVQAYEEQLQRLSTSRQKNQ